MPAAYPNPRLRPACRLAQRRRATAFGGHGGPGLSWPLPEDLSDEGLEGLLYPPPQLATMDLRPQPDWPTIHRELRRPGVTLQLLWEEHRGVYPDGYGYSRYCELYRAWEGRLSPTMRQLHVAGETDVRGLCRHDPGGGGRGGIITRCHMRLRSQSRSPARA
jgi:hypothetical protein